jgi:Tol biopolymer transport system component
MKLRTKSKLVLAFVSLILAASVTAARQAGETPAVLLERAIQLETVDGNLNAAIDLYKRIEADSASSRSIVARALLHLGECYEKLGRDEARKAYERLVRDYADQPEQAKEAQTRLAALDKSLDADKQSTLTTRLVWKGQEAVSPSPDGKYGAYVDFMSGNLGVRDLKAGTNRILTNEGTWEQPAQYAFAPIWSPDGKQIAYTWETDKTESQLRIQGVNDPHPRILFRDRSEGAWVLPQDWSSDGKFILARITGAGKPDQLALIPAKGGSLRVLKTFDLGVLYSGKALFSPDGRFIVYDRTPGKVAALDLFVMSLDEGKEIPLIQHPADDSLFGWSPDGKWIIFLSDRSGTLDLWAIQVAEGKPQGAPVRVKRSAGRIATIGFTNDGSFYYAEVKAGWDIYSAKIDFQTGKVLESPEKAVTRFEGSNKNPRYSPDGKWLAYVSRRGSMVFPTNYANALCIQSLETGTERVLMDEFVKIGVRSVARPRWAPDNRSLVVAGLQVVGSGRGLYQVRIDTGEASPVVVLAPEVQLLDHEFSADSRHLYYVQENRNRKLCQIVERDLRTGEEREIYQTPSGAEEPRATALSPEGKSLALLSFNRRILSVMPSSGGNPRAVNRFDQSGNTRPEWTNDGKHILVGGAKGILYMFPVEGGQPQEIKVGKPFYAAFTVHPDGRQIAFTSQLNADTDADVWVMRNFLPK